MAVIRFFRDFAIGLKSCWNAIPFLFKHNFWIFFIVSGAVAALAIFLAFEFSEDIMTYEIPEEDRGDLLKLTITVAIWFFKLLFLVMVTKMNKYIVLFLMPPFNTRISERTEYHLTGNRYKFSIPRLWNDIKRSLRIVVNNLLWEAGLLLVFLVAMLIFDQLKPIFPYYAFIVGLYFYGFSMMDYTLERLRMNETDAKKYIRKHMGMAVGIGFVYSSLITFVKVDFSWFMEDGFLKHLILYIGVIFAPVICVTAATMGIHEITDLSKNEFAIRPEGASNATPDTPESTDI